MMILAAGAVYALLGAGAYVTGQVTAADGCFIVAGLCVAVFVIWNAFDIMRERVERIAQVRRHR